MSTESVVIDRQRFLSMRTEAVIKEQEQEQISVYSCKRLEHPFFKVQQFAR